MMAEEGLDAEVDFTLAYTGRYSVIATSYGPDDLGSYTLTVEGTETATIPETGGPSKRALRAAGRNRRLSGIRQRFERSGERRSDDS